MSKKIHGKFLFIYLLIDIYLKSFSSKPQYSLASDLPLNLYKCEYENRADDWIYDEKTIDLMIRFLQGQWTQHCVK